MVVPTMDTLPRVPDTHGDVVDEKLFSDLYIRTTWVDAQIALDQIDKGKARGNRTSIYLRSVFQSHFESLGSSVQKHAGKVLFVAILVLSTFCVGLKSVQIHSKVHQLWIQEGGRLETELAYTQKTIGESESSTHQLLIQTGHDPNASVLHPQALLTHLEVLKKATAVKIHMFDTDWSLRDMCNSPTTPSFEGPYYIEQILKHLIPCSIITPLDCFWEGSQLLGPDFPVQIPSMDERITWSTLNPSKLMQSMKKQMSDQTIPFDFDTIEQYMKRAAISSGYTEKPCLDPKNPQCPETAPNKNSDFPLDVGGILTGGCYGFAAKYMHWPEELIVGGVQRNRTGHLKRAKGIQTVVQLMTEKELFDFWNENYKVHHISWTPEKAAEVLTAWQRNFSKEVENIMTGASMSKKYNVYVFSSATLDDILEKFSNPKPLSILIGVIATVSYAFCTLIRWRDPVKGQSSVGVAGVLLIGFSTAAGLGLCAILGIVFNAASTQVVPFLALGLGVDHIFMLTSAYAESNRKEQTKYILKKVGPSILFSSCSTTGAFFAAAFIPVPALKVFCLQAAIVMCFNLAAALLVFPAMISLDLRRRTAGRADISCCCFPIWKEQPVNPFQQIQNNNPLKNSRGSLRGSATIQNKVCKNGRPTSPTVNAARQEEALLSCSAEKNLPSFSLAKFAVKYYTPFLMKSWIKFIVITSFVGTVIFSLYASTKLQDGLDLIDLVPKDTNEYKFLNAQTSMFGFYSMYAVTQGNFEYPNNQRLLHEYHEAFVRVPHVIKNDNGGLPDFWLSLFRDWLRNLQKIFDREFKEGCINQEGWHPNATSDAILAYKLLVQTGHVDNPVDKALVVQHRLVDNEGIINPKAFYNYLSAWATNDVFAYGASQVCIRVVSSWKQNALITSSFQAKLHPEPRQYYHVPTETDLKIPKSLPLVYSQLPFYLHGLTDTSEIKSLIGHIRELSMRFESRGLPNYPSGIPFIFWEQYMTLRSSLAMILSCCVVVAFVLVCILLLSIWAAVLVILSVLASLAQIFGIMAILGIKLSALPAVILILSVGMMLCFIVHITLGFLTSVGNRERRVLLSMQVTLGPLTHGILTSTLAVFMLSTSPFEFVIRHFFWLLLAVLCVGAFNSLVMYPIVLSMVGPASELIPLEHPDRISTPSPQMSRNGKRTSKNIAMGSMRSSSRTCQKPHYNYKDNNDPSLTTITEEPPSWKSSNSSIPMNNEWTATNGGHYGNNINYANNLNYHHASASGTPRDVPPNYMRQHSANAQQQQHRYHYNQPTAYNPHHTTPPQAPPQYHHNQQQPPPQPPPPCSSTTTPNNASSVGSHQAHGSNVHGSNVGMENFPPELQSIVVQPEVTVETHHSDSNSTKVTATANIKVELVTPARSMRRYNFTSS
ncbi:protein patched-like isoform X1 [Musca domestica]|uniref:Protein patched-like isoform X1 n=1 Tax=Musca domestica TaxID=7370 RepID=A0ABM3V141_MUSDO|nr:protein patched-like isoform X1 [Musca domestica]XP_058979497.1 protein patched-like isoform X1 [Musca domestica]